MCAVLSDRSETKLTDARTLELRDDFWQLMEEMASALEALKCAIPGKSVPSEGVFSAAGLTVNRLRTRLTPDHVNMLIFLNKNIGV